MSPSDRGAPQARSVNRPGQGDFTPFSGQRIAVVGLGRAGLPAAQLGIPDLNDWLEANPPGTWASRGGHLTQWHYRWAQPVNCLIVVLLATPLGIVFSRRGTSGGVAMAVFLSAGMLFLSNVCLSFGDSGHLRPVLAAWLPNLVFGGLAIYLFQRRLAGRPIYQALRKFMPSEA